MGGGAGPGAVWLWLSGDTAVTADEPQARVTFEGHTNSMQSVAFSPDGKTLALADDKTVKLWDVKPAK